MVTGALPQGLPKPSFPFTSIEDVVPLFVAAVGITLVSLTDTIATATSFAARRGDEVDPNQEMIGMGASNIAAGCFQGFAISTSGSRTAVAEQSGAKTQVTGLVGAGVVALLLLFFPALLANLPQSALAAVVIAAALTLIDIPILRRYARVRRSALVLSIIASVGVILFGVLQGIAIAVVLSILLFFRRSWWPRARCSVGSTSSTDGTASERYPEAEERSDIVIYRWEAPLFFANSGMFLEAVRRLVRDRNPRWVVIECEAVTDVDVTAAEMLESLDRELNDKGVHLAFVELRTHLRDLVDRYGLHETLDREHFYPSIEMALEDIARIETGPGGTDQGAAEGP